MRGNSFISAAVFLWQRDSAQYDVTRFIVQFLFGNEIQHTLKETFAPTQ